MLTAYTIKNNVLATIMPSKEALWLQDAVWIDLINPTAEEIKTVEVFTGISLPNIQETEEIEASSHYEIYPTGLQINCSFLNKTDGVYLNRNVAFLCNSNCLISLCAHEIPAIRLLQKQWQKAERLTTDPLSSIIALHEIKINSLADFSEEAYLTLEKKWPYMN